nr:hypothetical protein Itr_chr08CG20520 [Ipomoea trifida]GLL46046.1 hypothetical protein Itr_chr14CG06620 [Ipomoea trifida]
MGITVAQRTWMTAYDGRDRRSSEMRRRWAGLHLRVLLSVRESAVGDWSWLLLTLPLTTTAEIGWFATLLWWKVVDGCGFHYRRCCFDFWHRDRRRALVRCILQATSATSGCCCSLFRSAMLVALVLVLIKDEEDGGVRMAVLVNFLIKKQF